MIVIEGKMTEVPVKSILGNARKGAVLVKAPDRFKVDEEATAARAKKLSKKTSGLFAD